VCPPLHRCRREDEDFLYRDDFHAFVQNQTLTALHNAFSRDPKAQAAAGQKVYVQHRLKEQGAVVAKLVLEKKAHVFVCGYVSSLSLSLHFTSTSNTTHVRLCCCVCGVMWCSDGNRMAGDVKSAFVEVLSAHGAMTPEQARAYVQDMFATKRYVQDIWS
jgi:NADPH-ferrihemoprotein reductase